MARQNPAPQPAAPAGAARKDRNAAVRGSRVSTASSGSRKLGKANVGNQAHPDAALLGKHLWWFVVSLAALIVLPNMYAGTFVPKMFWAVATVGLGWVFLPPRRPAQLAPTPLALIWFGYLAWALLSLTWAIQPRIGFERWAILTVWTCGYMVALRTRFWENARFWVLFQWLFIVICLIGILQFLFPDFPLVSWIPGSGLPASTMGHRNYACMYLSITLPFIGWLLLKAKGAQNRILPGVALLMGIAFLIFTRAREAWIAAVVSLVFMMACAGWSKIREFRKVDKRIILAAVLILVPLLLIGPAKDVSNMGLRWRALPDEKANIISTILHPFKRRGDPRLEMWIPALKMISPASGSWTILHGYGFGNFPIASTPMVANVRTLDYEIHNDYLQALVDLGLPGMFLFVAFFGCLLRLAWKERKQGLIIASGGAVVGLAVVQLFTFTSENISPILWMVGVAAILNGQEIDRPVWSARIPGWASRLGHTAVAVYLLVFCVVVGVAISAERKIYAETEISQRPDLSELANSILPRMQFNSNIAFIKSNELAAIAMEANMPEPAESFAKRALYLHPNDWISMNNLATLAAAKGQIGTAIHYLEKAAVVSEHSPDPGIWRKLQRLYAAIGKKELAEKAGQAAAAKLVTRPLNISPANGAANVSGPVEFSWKESPNAEKYDVYLWRKGDPFPNFPQVYHVKKNSAKLDMDLQPGATYSWCVKALGPTGNEDSEATSFTAVQ